MHCFSCVLLFRGSLLCSLLLSGGAGRHLLHSYGPHTASRLHIRYLYCSRSNAFPIPYSPYTYIYVYCLQLQSETQLYYSTACNVKIIKPGRVISWWASSFYNAFWNAISKSVMQFYFNDDCVHVSCFLVLKNIQC